MYFHNWLKKHGRGTYDAWVTTEELMNYLSKKDHPVAKKILKELKENPSREYYPIYAWDESYNFKT